MNHDETLNRRDFIKLGVAALGTAAFAPLAQANENKEKAKPTVYFCKDITQENLLAIYNHVSSSITGKVAIKLHTGEKGAPNLPPRALAKALQAHIPNSSLVECNVLYPGPRHNTQSHQKLLQENGWTFSEVDIMDADGDVALPIPGAQEFFEEKWGQPGLKAPFAPGNHLREIFVGKHLLNYDSLVVYTHFKGHPSGGYGGSLKNIAIGCASLQGKRQQHGDGWIKGELFQEHMVEAAKGIVAHFSPHICYINLLMNMSVDCDCAGLSAAKPECPDQGILASTDLAAVERASIDLVYAMEEQHKKALVERIESRKGLRQLEFMEIFGLGDGAYTLKQL
ncbi:MAG: DUF362 domain-containing protein [Desulfovibrio sp.]|nr:DUF362 domain-containing protein [Desulfovibrio sp.]